MPRPRSDFDTSWKEALEAFFPEAMALLFPEIHAAVDWEHDFEFMDQELRQAIRRARRGLRIVDKLAKVWKKDGEEARVLVHVEVQSQSRQDFAELMYVANALLFVRNRCPVVSLGVLGDTQPGWKPDRFGRGLWGCEVEMRFPVAKLLDFRDRWQELEESTNPFAIVVMAHLKTLETGKSPQSRMQWKLRLVRMLYERGYTEERIRQLFRFMELMMTLREDLEREFYGDLARYEEERKMPVLTRFEQRAIQKGRREGAVETARQALLDTLTFRFERVPAAITRRVNAIEDAELLRELHRTALGVASLEDFERQLPPAP